VSFWLPGEFGSLSAAPLVPGWAVGIINVYESVSASGNVAAAREVTIGKLNPNANVNLNFVHRVVVWVILAGFDRLFAVVAAVSMWATLPQRRPAARCRIHVKRNQGCVSMPMR
jgi:hypothetical protein